MVGVNRSWQEIAQIIAKEDEVKFIRSNKLNLTWQRRVEDLELQVLYLKEALREVVAVNIKLLDSILHFK